MGYIYKITNIVNNKLYIGQTRKTIEERFQMHIKKAKQHTNRYLYDAMNKYGYDNFIPSEIEECDDSLLDEREIYWIAYYNTTNKQYGYNMTIGGGGGDTWGGISAACTMELPKNNDNFLRAVDGSNITCRINRNSVTNISEIDTSAYPRVQFI